MSSVRCAIGGDCCNAEEHGAGEDSNNYPDMLAEKRFTTKSECHTDAPNALLENPVANVSLLLLLFRHGFNGKENAEDQKPESGDANSKIHFPQHCGKRERGEYHSADGDEKSQSPMHAHSFLCRWQMTGFSRFRVHPGTA
jgi:hypothetical protein